MEEFHTLGHWTLEGLPPGDEPAAARTLVDHRCPDSVGEITGSLRLTTAVDQTNSTHVVVHDLPTTPVDGVIGHERVVDEGRGLGEVHRRETAVFRGLLLLDDVGLNGDPEVIGLRREVC